MIGRIYKIQSRVDGCYYIGSTRLDINERFREHRVCRNRKTHVSIPIYAYFNLKGWDVAEVVLLREFENITDEELLWEERKEIDKSLETHDVRCLNKNRPIVTDAEHKEQVRITHRKWHQVNKERTATNLREWRRANPEKVKEQRERRADKSKEERTQYRQSHKDEERHRLKQWRIDNPEKYAEQCRRANERAREKRAAKKESK